MNFKINFRDFLVSICENPDNQGCEHPDFALILVTLQWAGIQLSQCMLYRLTPVRLE